MSDVVRKKLLPNKVLNNEQYHGEKEHFSSSQLKDVLEDIEYFYKVHISKEIVKERTGNQLNIGTYIHTAVLEPHLLESECAVFTGATRRGKEWDAFQEENKDKCIITVKEKEEAEGCINAVKNDPISMDYLSACEKEVSVFYQLHGVPLKARADAICHGAKGLNGGKPFVADLKSCSCNAKSAHEIQQAIEAYNYDLSAVLYMDLFSSIGGKNYEDFFWIFTSKKWNNAQVWKATPQMIATGRAKLRKALALIHEYAAKGWVFESRLMEISPKKWVQDEWLETPPPTPKQEELTDDTDLL